MSDDASHDFARFEKIKEDFWKTLHSTLQEGDPSETIVVTDGNIELPCGFVWTSGITIIAPTPEDDRIASVYVPEDSLDDLLFVVTKAIRKRDERTGNR